MNKTLCNNNGIQENEGCGNLQFYPTPRSFLEKITQGIDWRKINTVLEPSAGKGDIADYIMEKNKNIDLDVIELESERQKILNAKGYRLIHDNFLTFYTFKKYDLMVMNPPFAYGAAHLKKALEVQAAGGAILCLLNAQTIRNPFTREMKELRKILDDYGAEITFYDQPFQSSDAERFSNVEVAVIKVCIPEKYESLILDDLRKEHASCKEQPISELDGITDVTVNDFIQATVDRFNFEAKAGVQLISEYRALHPYLMEHVKENAYSKPILSLNMTDTNKFLKELRLKYWEALFKDSRFTDNMTSNQYEEYARNVAELADYDFSYYNIKSMQIKMNQTRIRSIEDTILEIFDLLTRHYYFEECGTNIHYYNGWSTNKAYMVNAKVIIPTYNYNDTWKKFEFATGFKGWKFLGLISDIEKVFNYLNGNLNDTGHLTQILQAAEDHQASKNIETKYMRVTCYKKGTTHIVFKDLELLKKLNIFAGRKKNWLPYSYGRKRYTEMDDSEKAVIDSFQGKEDYDKVMDHQGEYIIDSQSFFAPLIA